ncbi:MAG: transposase [Clostridia bacterium]|nr:transposase [Clostridia bacterium]
MARSARTNSKSGIYHVIVRGINRQNIFQDEEDKGVYLDRLTHYKNECGVKLYAYCLMSNHVHLLVRETDKPLSEFMKKLGTSYSYRFNRKYDRVGHLFQDRYKSEPVDDDSYFLTVFRYIHRNPQMAGSAPFSWTCYTDYAEQTGITDFEFPLSLFSSREELLQFLRSEADEKCMDFQEETRLTDEKAAEMICCIGGVKHSQQLQSIDAGKRGEIIVQLREVGLSIRQIERLTGINRGIISRV